MSLKIWNPGYTEFTYFWGEWPFSQWSDLGFTIGDLKFTHAEQFMMYGKAKLFKDDETAKLIMEATTPHAQKALGKKVTPFDEATWNSYAKKIVYTGNYAKFTQSPKALELLLATKGTLLVEASPRDKIWGIGISAFDAKCGKPWMGTNWLGEVLTKLRETLLEDNADTSQGTDNNLNATPDNVSCSTNS